MQPLPTAEPPGAVDSASNAGLPVSHMAGAPGALPLVGGQAPASAPTSTVPSSVPDVRRPSEPAGPPPWR